MHLTNILRLPGSILEIEAMSQVKQTLKPREEVKMPSWWTVLKIVVQSVKSFDGMAKEISLWCSICGSETLCLGAESRSTGSSRPVIWWFIGIKIFQAFH